MTTDSYIKRREEIATAAMHGCLCLCARADFWPSYREIAKRAVLYADALLKELYEEEKEAKEEQRDVPRMEAC